MAEAVGLASGLLTLASFALQSSLTLYNTIQSFRSHLKRVQSLVEEVGALNDILSSLDETIRAVTDVDLSLLDLPLLRCGRACRDFEQELIKCSSRSGGDRTSFRDWAKLRYMSDDIDGFTRLLAGYKSIINIALVDANLRKSILTAEQVQDYKNLVKTATDGLQAQLERINDKLEDVLERTISGPGADTAELRLMEQERLSTQTCLRLCEQLSNHIDQIQLVSKNDTSSPEPSDRRNDVPNRIVDQGLQECKNSLSLTVVRLEDHMREITDRLITKSESTMNTEDDLGDLRRLRDTWEAARQCRNICVQADNHLKENVSTIDNWATGDAIQFMVSTNGQILHGTNRGLGSRTRQVGGYLSDSAVIHLSRDMSRTGACAGESIGPSATDHSRVVPDGTVERGQAVTAEERRDRGIQSVSQPAPNTSVPLTRPKTTAGASRYKSSEQG